MFISATNPASGELLPGSYPIASSEDINIAMQRAHSAWNVYRKTSGAQRATFLRAIASNIEMLGNDLVHRTMLESGLPEARIIGERGRTCNQIRMFASMLDDGSWANEIVEAAEPSRTPIPKPSLRRSLVSVGPVVVFTASNFPLAFSTAGGDTISALAAGCTVVVKAHESHPGTNELVAKAIDKAAIETGMPDGVFATIYGKGHDIGRALVTHPLTASVAFTGSYKGGKALFDLACQRPTPIPVFAEMGSINPIFLLPEKLSADHAVLATQLAGSVCQSVGQFCTNPGLIIAIDSDSIRTFTDELISSFKNQTSDTMLNDGIYANYEAMKSEMISKVGVSILHEHSNSDKLNTARPTLASVSAETFVSDRTLQDEVFGPFTMLVVCEDADQMEQVASSLQGQLTASLMAVPSDLDQHRDLIDILETKVGRLILNGVPTGLEVSAAMHHGGPWPASSDSRYTSVGTAAVYRFVRWVCWQGW